MVDQVFVARLVGDAPAIPEEHLVAAAVGVPKSLGRTRYAAGIDAVAAGVEVAVAVAAPDFSGGLERRVRASGHVGGVEGQGAGALFGVGAPPSCLVPVLHDDVVEVGARQQVAGKADAVAGRDAPLAQRTDDEQGMVAAAAGDPAQSVSRLVQAAGVTVLVEVEEGLEPAAVDLVLPLFRQIRQLGAVVADHRPGSE